VGASSLEDPSGGPAAALLRKLDHAPQPAVISIERKSCRVAASACCPLMDTGAPEANRQISFNKLFLSEDCGT